MATDDLTILINTFNSDEKIFDCLNSIDNKYKILVIENSNNFDFKKKIESRYSNVTCELSGENLGYAKGNNLGLSKISTKFVLILNPDAILSKSAINQFFKSAETKPEFGIIGPAIQETKDKKYSNLTRQENLIEVRNVKGFAMFLNLKHFKNIGFFDDNFFIYFEEIDLCKRLENNNIKIYLDPKIIIEHLGGSSHNSSINFEMELSRNWHWMWSSFYYYKKHHSYIYATFKILRKLISAFVKTMYFMIINNKKKRLIYFQRLSGITNSMMGKKSWYRPKIF